MAGVEQNPFAPPSSELGAAASPEEIASAPLAGRGTRLAAAILDTLLYMPLVIPLAVVVAMAEGGTEGEAPNETLLMGVIGVCGLAALGLAIFQWYLIATAGQTLGKRWLKIKIVKLDGSPVNFVNGVLLRIWVLAFMGAIPYVGNIVGLVDALMIFGEERRCMHDHIAGTKVIQVV